MNQQETLEWIATLFEEPTDSLTPETSRDDIPMWDSLGVLTLMAGLDEKFSILMTDADMKGMQKVDDILAVLRQHGKLNQPS
jgi:acyl carrier protein